MAGQICVDTSVCIEIIKGDAEIISALDIHAQQIMQASAITVFELLMRKNNLDAVENFVNDIQVLDFDAVVARKASNIEKELRQAGNLISREDIFIAATAIANDCALATLNVKDFSKIKGLRLVKLK